MRAIAVAALLFTLVGCQSTGDRPAKDRIDDVLDMTSVDQCLIKSNLYVQGIRAYHLEITVDAHIKSKQKGVLTPREYTWMAYYMKQGHKKAMIIWGMNPGGISQQWALSAGQAFNRVCIAGVDNEAIEV